MRSRSCFCRCVEHIIVRNIWRDSKQAPSMNRACRSDATSKILKRMQGGAIQYCNTFLHIHHVVVKYYNIIVYVLVVLIDLIPIYSSDCKDSFFLEVFVSRCILYNNTIVYFDFRRSERKSVHTTISGGKVLTELPHIDDSCPYDDDGRRLLLRPPIDGDVDDAIGLFSRNNHGPGERFVPTF